MFCVIFDEKETYLECLYTCTFWIVLQQFKKSYQERTNYRRRASFLESRYRLVQIVGEFVVSGMAKYWIWFAGGLWFAMGFVGLRMTVQRVLYVGLFHLYILNFQITYHFWMKTLYATWLLIALFSFLVLIIIYTFQFDNFPYWWEKYLKLPKKMQQDFGLRQYDSANDLISHMLPVVCFITAAVIYLHLYHDRFLAMTDPARLRVFRSWANITQDDTVNVQEITRDVIVNDDTEMTITEPDETDSDDSEFAENGNDGSIAQASALPRRRHTRVPAKSFKQWRAGVMKKIKHYYPIVTELGWRVLYLYLDKVAMFSIGTVCIYDVCLAHFVLLVVIMVALLCGQRFHLLAIRLVAVGVAVCMMARLIYQIDFFDHSVFDIVCLDSDGFNIFPAIEMNDAEWLGLHKINHKIPLSKLISGYCGLIFIFTIMACAIYRLTYMLLYKQVVTRQEFRYPDVMFPNVNRKNADDCLSNFVKFLVSYGFYKFGVEICFIMIAFLMARRMDLYAVTYGIWLCVMVYLPRRILARVWTLFIFFVAIIIPFQYLMSIGLPYSMCVVYPWHDSYMLRNIQEWFYLPDNTLKPLAYLLMCDFIVLIFACHQYYVFLIEAKEDVKPCDGGSNKDITHKLDDPDFVNPIPDFFPISKSWLDTLKRIGSQAFLWLTLSVVFLTGVNRVNVFSFGYLGLTYFYLWHGEKLYLRPTRTIIWQWNFFLLGYNLAVMMLKMVLQIVGCVFVRDLMETACWAIELLGISCYTEHDEGSEECPLPATFAGLWWDIVCFSALIFMRRFFGSCYFLHLVNETKVMIALADRGAYLFEKYHENKLAKQLQREDANFELVLKNMQQIVERQKRIQGARYKKFYWHYEVIRQGDYYMFEDDIKAADREKEEFHYEKILLKPTTKDKKEGVQTPEDKDKAATKKTKPFTLWRLLQLISELIEDVMASLAIVLQKISRDYLYVSRMLELTKNTLKANSDFLIGKYDENGLWEPAKPVEEYLKDVIKQSDEVNFKALVKLHESQSTTVMLLSAIFYVSVSNSQYACFFIICLLQIRSASLMSLPMPMMVFLWAVFISPRPTRIFWVTLLVYTKAIVIIKCIFQFRFIPLEEHFDSDHPFEPAIFVGLDRSRYYVTYELILLLAVYSHRLIQKSMGLWEHHVSSKSTESTEESHVRFFEHLEMPIAKVPSDVYTMMFLCSFVNFLVILFGFVSFGVDQPDGSVMSIFERNRIPMQLLVLLLIQFAFIIIDRGIYLRRAVKGRTIMHFFQLFLIHLWLFFILPATSLRPFNFSVYPQVFYMVFAAYLLFSAYQIRRGFPHRVFGNVLCQGYNLHNFVLFKAYMNIPFLFEIRGIMDWMFTTTSMTLASFLTMESIYSHVFELECYGTLEVMFGYPSATKIRSGSKWWMGGLFLILIFGIIWFPLIIFTVGMAVGTSNTPHSATFSVEVSGHAVLYRTNVRESHIVSLNAEMWADMKQLYKHDRRAMSFLNNFENTDVAVIFIEANSSSVWEATPVDQNRLETTVRDTSNPVIFSLKWQLSRFSKDNTYTGMSMGSRDWTLTGDDPIREALSSVLSYNNTLPFFMPKMIPKFLDVTNQDKADPIFYLIPNGRIPDDAFRDMKMRLYLDNVTLQDWWEVREANCAAPTPELLGQLPFFKPDCANIYIYTFNEKMMPLTLSKLISGQGIIALYLTFVYVIGLFIRSLTVSSVNDIMFFEIPYIERVLQLCHNIYLAREYEELALEEYLYSQLLFLFRSPETFIKWVRPDEDEETT